MATSPLFTKLNLKDQNPICVLHALASFEPERAKLQGVAVARSLTASASINFVIAFVQSQREVDAAARALIPKLEDDAVVRFSYPKGTSKKYPCDFNRDIGWAGPSGARV